MPLIGYKGPENIIPVGYGKIIDDRLFEMDMTYKKLSELVGVDKKTIRRILEGGDCRLSTMMKISRILGLSMDELCGGKYGR